MKIVQAWSYRALAISSQLVAKSTEQFDLMLGPKHIYVSVFAEHFVI